MTDQTRLKLAALVTALFLATVSAAGVIAHSSTHPPATVPVTHVVSSSQSRGSGQSNLVPPSQDHEHD